MKQILRDLWALHLRTTNGEWEHYEDFEGHTVLASTPSEHGHGFNSIDVCREINEDDSVFIATAHTMFPRLLQALELLLEKDDLIFREHFFQNPDMEFIEKVNKLENRIKSILEGIND